MTVDRPRKTFMALLSASTLVLALAAPAHADRRSPAPISFGGSGSQVQPQAQQPQARAQISSQTGQANANPRTSRIEFRYPDQPNTFYGSDGPRAANADTNPIAFASAETALSVQDAQRYTAPKDPSITSGGFDARAAAAQVQAQRTASAPSKPIRIASLQLWTCLSTARLLLPQ